MRIPTFLSASALLAAGISKDIIEWHIDMWEFAYQISQLSDQKPEEVYLECCDWPKDKPVSNRAGALAKIKSIYEELIK